MSDTVRRHVKPALATASILDVARGDFLPPEGRNVTMSALWRKHEGRGDIIVSDEQPEPVAAPEAPPEPPAA